MRAVFLILLSLTSSLLTFAQGVTINGKVQDATTGEALPAATVALITSDTKETKSVVTTNNEGVFTFYDVLAGSYIVSSTYVGYLSKQVTVKASEGKPTKVRVDMREDMNMLSEVSVQGHATRAEQRGDTLVYNADAFKVQQGSTVSDLLSKMPGIVVEGGSIQAQGEEVEKILVDGKEFFDGDINAAVKNLSAEMIKDVEVYDKKSDQAEFSGFDDGEEIKTINLVTRPSFRQKMFGDFYGGYGYGLDNESRYKAGGNLNIFNDDQRISVLGLSNNINQLNFSQEDLAGVMSSSSGGGRRGGPPGQGGASESFMVSSSDGVTTSNGLGINFVDNWAGKVDFTGSYFLSKTHNVTQEDLLREYFDAELLGLTYDEYQSSIMNNWSHRISMKFDYKINDYNSIIIRPSFSFQSNDTESYVDGTNLFNDVATTQTVSTGESETKAYTVGGEAVFRHRFKTAGRTLSVMGGATVSNTDWDSYTGYLNSVYSTDGTTDDSYGLHKTNQKLNYTVRGNVMYTESLSKTMQLQLAYKSDYSNRESNLYTYNLESVNDLYEQLDESLSDKYTSDYLTQTGAVGIRFNKGGLRGMVMADIEWASLVGDQFYPEVVTGIGDTYLSVLPSMMMHYEINKKNSLRLHYRSNSSAPDIDDLQSALDNSNPLFVSSGNPELDQEISHQANLRYVGTMSNAHTIIAMLGGTYRQDYVGESTIIATEETILSPSVTLDPGAQYTKPVNLNGYYSAQAMFTYGLPVDFIRSNLNVSLSANYANVPTIFNSIESYTREFVFVPKVVIGSNISENIDFTATYSASMNKTLSTSADSNDSDYTYHLATAKFGWMFWRGFTFNASYSYGGYRGLDDGNIDISILNASIGKRFLKNNAAEIKLEFYDILNQNEGISYTVGSNYYDWSTTNVLSPFAMITFTYSLR